MHAVFSMTDLTGVDSHVVYLFEDEDAAKQFIVNCMIGAKAIEVAGGKWIVGGVDHECVEDAVDSVQVSFDATEFFHDYPVIDKRKESE